MLGDYQMIDQYLRRDRQGHRGRRAAGREKVPGRRTTARSACWCRPASCPMSRAEAAAAWCITRPRSAPRTRCWGWCRCAPRARPPRWTRWCDEAPRRRADRGSGAALAATLLIAAFAAPAAALEIKRIRLPNGAVLLVSEQHQLPMVTMTIAFDAGARRDPEGKEGLAALTASSLTQGTKELSATEFNQKVDFMGSSISVGAGADYAQASFTSLKKYEDADPAACWRRRSPSPGSAIRRNHAQTRRAGRRQSRPRKSSPTTSPRSPSTRRCSATRPMAIRAEARPSRWRSSRLKMCATSTTSITRSAAR